MENNPTAAAEAPKAPETEAAPQNTNPEPAQAPAPDMHGFTSDQLADMKKFFDANGGFDKIKSKISNPTPAPGPQQQNLTSQPQQQPQPQPEAPAYKAPEGAITAQEFLAQQYFEGLSRNPKYAGISEQIANGDILKEMAAFNIRALNQDGSLNDGMVRKFLDLKAQTVPAKPTAAEPDASAAPTVSYVNVGDKIENIDQAYQVIMQPNHPKSKEAEEFIKSHLNPNSDKKS